MQHGKTKGPGGSKQCSILNVYELWPSLSLSGQKRLLVLDPPLIPSQRICLLLCTPAASRLRSSRFTCRATYKQRRGAARHCVFDKSASPRWLSLPDSRVFSRFRRWQSRFFCRPLLCYTSPPLLSLSLRAGTPNITQSSQWSP